MGKVKGKGKGKNEAFVKNASDPKQVEAGELKEEEKEALETRDLLTVLGTPEGRRVLWGILERCGVYKTSFTGNSETFFNEGKRSIGLELISKIGTASDDALFTMMKEAKDREIIE